MKVGTPSSAAIFMDTLGKDIFKHCEKELGCFPHEETVLDRHITLLLLGPYKCASFLPPFLMPKAAALYLGKHLSAERERKEAAPPPPFLVI